MSLSMVCASANPLIPSCPDSVQGHCFFFRKWNGTSLQLILATRTELNGAAQFLLRTAQHGERESYPCNASCWSERSPLHHSLFFGALSECIMHIVL